MEERELATQREAHKEVAQQMVVVWKQMESLMHLVKKSRKEGTEVMSSC